MGTPADDTVDRHRVADADLRDRPMPMARLLPLMAVAAMVGTMVVPSIRAGRFVWDAGQAAGILLGFALCGAIFWWIAVRKPY